MLEQGQSRVHIKAPAHGVDTPGVFDVFIHLFEFTDEPAVLDEVIVVVDRESGAEEKLKNADVSFIPLLSVSDILKK